MPTGWRLRNRNSWPRVSKYSENHPDVRRLRREIATLSAEVSGEPTGQPTNPAYIQLQAQANAADVEVRELAARRNQISAASASAQGAITLSPKLEEEYTDLVRDYTVIKTQFEQMRAQQATAELKAKVAGSAAAESYVLINPARVPEDPVQPDRLALMFLGVVLSIAAGLGNGFPAELGGFHHSRQFGRGRTGRRGAVRACSGYPQPDRVAPPTRHGPCAWRQAWQWSPWSC